MRGERGERARERLRVLREAARPAVLGPPEVQGGWVPDGEAPLDPVPDPVLAPVLDPFLDPVSERRGEPDDVRPAPRTVRPAAAVAAVVLAVVVAAVVCARSAPPAAPVAVLPPRSSTAPAPLPPTVVAGAPAAAGATVGTVVSPRGVVVDVEGRVRHPGLVHLPAGARVADALAAAGGAAPGAVVARLNLARVLADGEQVLVPAPGDPVAGAAPPSGAPAAGDAGSAAGAAAGPLDLNAATAAALDQLPGVGPVLAGRIVAWRAAHGRFTTVDELGEVEGIGPKALERLRPLVRV